jgi:hypothetical protein
MKNSVCQSWKSPLCLTTYAFRNRGKPDSVIIISFIATALTPSRSKRWKSKDKVAVRLVAAILLDGENRPGIKSDRDPPGEPLRNGSAARGGPAM